MDDARTKDNPGYPGSPGGPVFLGLSRNSVARDLVAVLLKKERFSVEISATPEDAVARLRAKRFAGAFVDMQADGLLAYEVLPRLRAADSEVKLVVLAGEGDPEIAEWAAKVHAETVLIRPFEGDAIVRTARTIARSGRNNAPAEK